MPDRIADSGPVHAARVNDGEGNLIQGTSPPPVTGANIT